MEWAALYVLLANVKLWNWATRDVDYGSVPDYLTVSVAALALVYAARAAVAGKKAAAAAEETNKNQSEQLQSLRREQARLEDERRSQQANLIAAWGDPMADSAPMYRVSNRSHQPVYDFRVWHYEWDHAWPSMNVSVLPPGEWTLPVVEIPSNPGDITMVLFQVTTAFVFTDGTEQKWMRSRGGALRPIDEYPDEIYGSQQSALTRVT